MIAVAVAFLFPVYALVTLSLKDPQQIAASPLSPPTSPTFANFGQAWERASFGSALLNSTVITVVSVAVLIAIGSFAAYFIARWQTRLGYGLYVLFLLGIVLPFQLGMIPLFKLVDGAGLLGTYQGMIVFYTGIQLPFTIFLYTGYMRTLPRAYDEAGKLDGGSDFQVFRYIIFPMMRPVTGTVLILNCVFVWNDFMTPLLYLQGSSWATIPVAVASFVDQEITDWGIVFAALLIGIAPVMVLFAVLQKRMMEGFAGGLKA
jgi:raffinose/stachyose/melibiose transport system permease protein